MGGKGSRRDSKTQRGTAQSGKQISKEPSPTLAHEPRNAVSQGHVSGGEAVQTKGTCMLVLLLASLREKLEIRRTIWMGSTSESTL